MFSILEAVLFLSTAAPVLALVLLSTFCVLGRLCNDAVVNKPSRFNFMFNGHEAVWCFFSRSNQNWYVEVNNVITVNDVIKVLNQ